ncbi:MAG: Asp-tRNA(Asn)/Glu-tRNA(Gln) amidotransferase subunit GatC [Candidatus Pacebacteria bacterium]|nr:Asp-tRNA(Asn)/Glu-tRNA(Gln) amidotransferase subunit GatC [Candidatus Paceibacterota bacterium]
MTDNKKISTKEVEHIADLARIELTSEETEKYANELSDVLGYIDQLAEVNTKEVEPVSQVTGIMNALRDDVAEDCDEDSKDKIIDNFPQGKDGYIKVKQVM